MGSCNSKAHEDDKPIVTEADQDIFTILLLGKPGQGKSLLSNFLIDGYNSGKFKSGETGERGITKVVQVEEGRLFNIPANQSVRIIDSPGLMDPTISTTEIIKGIQNAVKGKTVDAVLIPIIARSRFEDYSIIAFKFAEILLQTMPKNFFFVFTHCDVMQITEAYVPAYLNNYETAGITVRHENHIKFHMKIDDLKVFETA